MGNFVEEQKAVNTQANQRIDIVEGTLNKKIENLTTYSTQFQGLQTSSRCKKKGNFPLKHNPILEGSMK